MSILGGLIVAHAINKSANARQKQMACPTVVCECIAKKDNAKGVVVLKKKTKPKD